MNAADAIATTTEVRDFSIARRLEAIGLGHRADSKTANDSRRVIFNRETGQDLGRFDVFEAIELLSKARA